MLVAVLLLVNFDIYMHIHRSLLVVVVVLADSVSILPYLPE